MRLQQTINSINVAKGALADAELFYGIGSEEEFVANHEQNQLILDWLQALQLQCRNLNDFLQAISKPVEV